MATQISTKRLAISKANAQVVLIVAAAAFVTVFCLVAAQATWSQNQYQARVIKDKEKARDQLNDNIEAFDQLVKSYKSFNDASPNAIGGNPKGQAGNDGNNSKIILNALPSAYDFPALVSSVEKVLKQSGLKVSNITGIDEGANQTAAGTSTPKEVEIPFSFAVEGASYNAIQQLTEKLEKSTRPIIVDTVDLSGSNSNMTATVTAHTYYQPATSLQITKKVVK